LATASPEGPAPIIATLLTLRGPDDRGSDPISCKYLMLNSKMGHISVVHEIVVGGNKETLKN
jgi:hypothetical protein